MEMEKLQRKLIEEFGLGDLPPHDQEEMLLALAETIYKQFLHIVYKKIGAQQFDALQTSANMGDEFYMTTLRHLVPDHEEMFQEARSKILTAFKKTNK
jgi:hypothetical protein